MLEATPLAIAVAGAVAYGFSDFAGGRASVRLPTLAAVAMAQTVAALGVLALALTTSVAQPGHGQVGLAALAGIGHAAGVFFLYYGIAHGRVAVVVPVSAVSSFALPLIGDLVTGQAPALIQLAGVAIAALSIVLSSYTGDAGPVGSSARTSLQLGLATGLGFGISDLGLGLMPEDLAVSALIIARLSGALAAAAVVSVFLLAHCPAKWIPVRRNNVRASKTTKWFPGSTGVETPVAQNSALRIADGVLEQWPAGRKLLLGVALAATAGVLDASGQLAYTLAATRGQMSIASATTALYPAVVVGLSIWLLKERLSRTQLTGILACLVSIPLMAG